MLDRYAREDARIRVIHQPNAGQAAARNAGVAAARGAYLTFVDSDDQIEPDLVGSLLRAMTQAGADAAICDARTFHGDAPPAPAKRGGVEVMTGAQAMRRMLYQRDYDTAPWGKMYRTELVRAHPFPEGRIFEDLFAVYRMLFDAERVAYVREPLYLYRINPEGTMRQAFRPAVLDAADAADEIVSFAQSRAFCRPAQSSYVHHISLPCVRQGSLPCWRARTFPCARARWLCIPTRCPSA